MRVQPKTRENHKLGKRAISRKNSSPDSKADFPEKSKFGTWRLILVRYDIVLVRYDLIFDI